MSALQTRFNSESADWRTKLKEELGAKNLMALPKLSKIVLNLGVKDALSDKKNVEKASVILAALSGQKPKVTKAKKAISSFKLRQGDEIGLTVTIRGKRMYSFFEKLTNIVLPRLRDFHGVSQKSFDGRGNYSLGFNEYTVFPEIDPSKVDKIQGLEVVIVTTAKNNEEGSALLKILGMPFAK
ncbi:MAG: 50S ribosomal protein L5 [Candidatus Levyibacteriota bacterium]